MEKNVAANKPAIARSVLSKRVLGDQYSLYSYLLRIMRRKGGIRVLIALPLLAGMADPLSAQPNAPPPANLCDTPGHHQFDFWVGRWDVFRSDTNQLVAHSLVEQLYSGCAVRENWMPLQSAGGGSINVYQPKARQWRQLWADSANSLNDYSGGLRGKTMVLTGTSLGPSGAVTRVRMTYEPQKDGSVVQTGYDLPGAGKRWQLRYQFVYRPAKP